MQFQIGEEVDTVIRIDISDEASDITMRVVHLDETYRVHYCSVYRCTGIVYRLCISSESVQVGINRNGRIDSRSCPDGFRITERVVIDGTFCIDIQLQMVFKERRVERNTSGVSFGIVRTEQTALVVVTYRYADGPVRSNLSGNAQVVVRSEGILVYFIVPVGAGCPQQGLLGSRSLCPDGVHELVVTQHVR